MNAVEVEGLAVDYGRARALEGVSVTIPAGEVVAILGMNGSGKTTLMKAMAGLLRPAEGSVRVLGGLSPLHARARIGAGFDEPAHWDALTGWENAWFFACGYGLAPDDAREQLDSLFQWTGMWSKRDDPVATYSYGMRRKLALIEALAHRPELLFLDEPSMGLDHVSRIALYRVLKDMARRDRTVVVTTNDVEEAAILADRICVLDGGRLVAVAHPQELVSLIERDILVKVTLSSPHDLASLQGVEGVERVRRGDEASSLSVVFALSSGPRTVEETLANIVGRLASTNASVREVKVDRPDLGHVLVALSGRGKDGSQ